MQSDGEEAMLALKMAVALKRQAETPMIESPVRESNSNGQIDRQTRCWQGQFRTLKTYFGDTTQAKPERSHVPVGRPISRQVPFALNIRPSLSNGR